MTGNNTWTNFATTENPVLTFGIGNYSVNLTSTTLGGSNTSTNTAFINVSAPRPVFISAATNIAGTSVNITFSKTMSATNVGIPTDYTVLVGGVADTVTGVALNTTTNIIDLTLTTAVTNGQTVTVAYTGTDVKSADGGVLAIFTAQTVTNNVPVPPIFSSATTNTAGTTINITFSKTMNSPAGDQGQFNYSINGGIAQPFSAASLDSSNNYNITLTTSGVAIAYGNIVTVSYTTGSVTSSDGGILATFTNRPVTNAMPAHRRLYQQRPT